MSPGAHAAGASFRRGLRLVIGAIALAAAVVALVYWPRPNAGYSWTFWLWLSSGAVFLAALPRGRRSESPTSPAVWIGLLAILAYALALRLPALHAIPANVAIDEMLPGLEALRISQGKTANVFSSLGWFTIPNLSFALPAVFMWAMPDETFFALRLSSLCTGLAGIVGTFLLARRFFGSGVGLTAAFLMAAGFWHLHNSRTGFPFVQTSFAVPWVLYLLVRARQQHSPAGMAAAGVALGFALQLYFPVRILVLLVPLFLVVGWIGRRDNWRRCAADVGLLAIGAAFALAPLLTSVPLREFVGRSQGVLLTRPAVFAELSRIYRVESVPAVVVRNFQESFGMLVEWADVCILNRSPDGLFDTVTLAAIALGVLVAVFQARGYALLFVAWVTVVFVLGAALSDAPRASYRLSPAMPAFYILAAYGIHATILSMRPGPHWYRVTVVPCLLAAFAGWITLANYDSFFHDYAREGDGRAMPPAAAVRHAGERCEGREIYFIAHPEPFGADDMVNVFCRRHRSIEVEDVPRRVTLERPATFIVMSWQRESIERLLICYPDALVEEHRTEDRRFLFTSVDVEIRALEQGKNRCSALQPDSMRRLQEMAKRFGMAPGTQGPPQKRAPAPGIEP